MINYLIVKCRHWSLLSTYSSIFLTGHGWTPDTQRGRDSMPGPLVEWRVHCLFFLFLFQRARSNPSLQLPSHSDGPGPAPPNLPWNGHDAQQRPFGPITVHPWTGPGRTNWPWCHGGKWPALMFFFIYILIFFIYFCWMRFSPILFMIVIGY